jgi:hypothetical protein
VRNSLLVNHFYFYCFDDDFGPFFLKFCSYFPFTAKLCINGNEWAKRQTAKAGIGFTALDNGFAAVDDPTAVQAICDRLGPEHIDALLCKWLARLPHPFTAADRAADYRYAISILQAEFSLTQMLDAPYPDGSSSNRSSGTTSTWAAPIRSGWSSTGASTPRAATPPRAGSAPGSSPPESSPACTSTTSTQRSSSTTRKAGRFAPRPPSTTRTTSASVKD